MLGSFNVSVEFHANVFCEAWNDDTDAMCGFEGSVLCEAIVEVDGRHEVSWVCSECFASHVEERDKGWLPEFVQLFV